MRVFSVFLALCVVLLFVQALSNDIKQDVEANADVDNQVDADEEIDAEGHHHKGKHGNNNNNKSKSKSKNKNKSKNVNFSKKSSKNNDDKNKKGKKNHKNNQHMSPKKNVKNPIVNRVLDAPKINHTTPVFSRMRECFGSMSVPENKFILQRKDLPATKEWPVYAHGNDVPYCPQMCADEKYQMKTIAICGIMNSAGCKNDIHGLATGDCDCAKAAICNTQIQNNVQACFGCSLSDSGSCIDNNDVSNPKCFFYLPNA